MIFNSGLSIIRDLPSLLHQKGGSYKALFFARRGGEWHFLCRYLMMNNGM